MNAKRLETFLLELLENEVDEGDAILNVATYEESGVLSNNRGLVVGVDGPSGPVRYHVELVGTYGEKEGK